MRGLHKTWIFYRWDVDCCIVCHRFELMLSKLQIDCKHCCADQEPDRGGTVADRRCCCLLYD